MPKILILNNAELFKVMVQIKENLLTCEFYHSTDNSAPLPDGIIAIISNLEILEKFNDKNIALIGLTEDSIPANSRIQQNITLVKKPYRAQEIIEIIQSIITNISAPDSKIQLGDFLFDTDARKLLKDEKEISLTEKEFALIMLLNQAGGDVVSREEILKKVWQYDPSVDTHTVETHIYRIRQKTGKESDFIGSSVAGYFLRSR